MIPPPKAILAFRDHTLAAFPHEACGLLIGDEFVPVENRATDKTWDFRIDARDMIRPGIQAVLHSHTRSDLLGPSYEDLCGAHRWPQLLHGVWRTDGVGTTPLEFFGDQAGITRGNLVGRRFLWGVRDCATLVIDYYERILGIRLRDKPRRDSFWEDGEDEWPTALSELGFVQIQQPELHAVMLLRYGNYPPAHAAVISGINEIIHQPQPRVTGREQRLSRRDSLRRWQRQAHSYWRLSEEAARKYLDACSSPRLSS